MWVSRRGLGVPRLQKALWGELAVFGLHDRAGRPVHRIPTASRAVAGPGRSSRAPVMARPDQLGCPPEPVTPPSQDPRAAGPGGTTHVSHLTGA